MKTLFKLLFLLTGFPLLAQVGTDSLIYLSELEAYIDVETGDTIVLIPESELALKYKGDTCGIHANISVNAVVNYETGSIAYVEFEGKDEVTTIQLELEGSESFRSIPIEANGFFIEGLEPNKRYRIQVADRCGEMAQAGVIETFAEPEHIITVSNRFYDLAVAGYLSKESTTSFLSYLDRLSGVHEVEKWAYIQQYYFNGAVFQRQPNTPPPPPPPPTPEEEECFCKYVSTETLAQPAKTVEKDYLMGDIFGVYQTGSSPNDGKKKLGKNAEWWRVLGNEGPAKWHDLQTGGWKAPKGSIYKKFYGVQGDEDSYQRAGIKLTLQCLDRLKHLPECNCTKDVRAWWNYETNVNTYASVARKSTGSKKAMAQAADLGVIVWTEDPSVFDGSQRAEVLDAISVSAAAKCDLTVNPEFQQAVDTTVKTAISNILEFSIDSLGPFFNQLVNLIGTPKYLETECDNVKSVYGTASGFAMRELKANQPVKFIVMSFDTLEVGGQRSWHSAAHILSNYSLAIYLEAIQQEPEAMHCCSPHVIAWNLSSWDGPSSTESLKREIAFDLGVYGGNGGNWNFVGNPQTVPYEYGWAKSPSDVAECNELPVNPRAVYAPALTEKPIRQQPGVYDLSVMDMSGRLIRHKSDVPLNSTTDPNELLSTVKLELPTGMYVFRLQNANEIMTYKIVIP